MLVPWQGCTISIKMKSWENCKVLSILYWPYDATKTIKNVSTREWLPVTIRLLQSFYYTVFFFSICTTAHVTEHIALKNWRIWKNVIREIKESYQLVVYLYKYRKDSQQEQQFMCEANKTSTMMPKLLVVLQIFQPNTSVQMVYEQVSNK